MFAKILICWHYCSKKRNNCFDWSIVSKKWSNLPDVTLSALVWTDAHLHSLSNERDPVFCPLYSHRLITHFLDDWLSLGQPPTALHTHIHTDRETHTGTLRLPTLINISKPESLVNKGCVFLCVHAVSQILRDAAKRCCMEASSLLSFRLLLLCRPCPAIVSEIWPRGCEALTKQTLTTAASCVRLRGEESGPTNRSQQYQVRTDTMTAYICCWVWVWSCEIKNLKSVECGIYCDVI